MKTIFVTGGTGFIGRQLLAKLAFDKSYKIYCLTRQSRASLPELSTFENIHFLQASIFDPHVYRFYLAKSDVVIHLAAVTGKANIKDYFRVNVEGTRLLVQQSEAIGVKHFIFISSIAAKFKSISNYYYAQSKKQAETAVKKSRLNYTIIRPTIVIGNEAPIWQNLSKLAKGPIPLIFGDGKTKIQPIFIEDLIDCLIPIINDRTTVDKEIDIGGPEIINFELFLQKIRQKHYGKTSRIFHIPLKPIITALKLLEKNLYDYLPLNVGQLTPFYMDSVIEENVLFANVRSRMCNVEEMLDIVVNEEKSGRTHQQLITECIAFCNYLVQRDPDEYVINNYCKVHEIKLKDLTHQPCFFERILLYVATMNSLGTKLVDVYTSVFLKKGIFRQKLIVLLSILECNHPYHLILDIPNFARNRIIIPKFILKTISFMVFLILASLIFWPINLAYYIQAKPKH